MRNAGLRNKPESGEDKKSGKRAILVFPDFFVSELRTAVFTECGRGYFAVFREDSREIVAVAEPAAFRDAVDGFAALQQIQCGEIQFLIQNETLPA